MQRYYVLYSCTPFGDGDLERLAQHGRYIAWAIDVMRAQRPELRFGGHYHDWGAASAHDLKSLPDLVELDRLRGTKALSTVVLLDYDHYAEQLLTDTGFIDRLTEAGYEIVAFNTES